VARLKAWLNSNKTACLKARLRLIAVRLPIVRTQRRGSVETRKPTGEQDGEIRKNWKEEKKLRFTP
jgi:hypothetical protein